MCQNRCSRPKGTPSTQTIKRGRLHHISDWEQIAAQACYSSKAIAKLCGVSLRHLQRHIRAVHNLKLGQWLNGVHLDHALLKLQAGCSVKEAAYCLGFKQVAHFSRLFKQHHGVCPSEIPVISPSLQPGSAGETSPKSSSHENLCFLPHQH